MNNKITIAHCSDRLWKTTMFLAIYTPTSGIVTHHSRKGGKISMSTRVSCFHHRPSELEPINTHDYCSDIRPVNECQNVNVLGKFHSSLPIRLKRNLTFCLKGGAREKLLKCSKWEGIILWQFINVPSILFYFIWFSYYYHPDFNISDFDIFWMQVDIWTSWWYQIRGFQTVVVLKERHEAKRLCEVNVTGAFRCTKNNWKVVIVT